VLNGSLNDVGLVVGVAATRPGVYNIASFAVTYRVGSTVYRALIYQGVTLCATLEHERACERRAGTNPVFNTLEPSLPSSRRRGSGDFSPTHGRSALATGCA
jgi:hypothetical protein